MRNRKPPDDPHTRTVLYAVGTEPTRGRFAPALRPPASDKASSVNRIAPVFPGVSPRSRDYDGGPIAGWPRLWMEGGGSWPPTGVGVERARSESFTKSTWDAIRSDEMAEIGLPRP